MCQPRQTFLALLLSHHGEDQLQLCYRLQVGRRSIFLCARCLGLLPAMFGVLLFGRIFPVWPGWVEWTLLFLAPLPAMLDWGTVVALGKKERANWVRLLGGVGLGLGLGANLQVNTRALMCLQVVGQLTFFLGSVWLVWLVSYGRRSQRLFFRRQQRPTLEEVVLETISHPAPNSRTGAREDSSQRGSTAATK